MLFKSFNFSGNTYMVKNYDRVATDLYVDAPLTNISIAYKNMDNIADLIIPRIPVKTETGVVFKKDFSNFAIKDLQRGDKSKSKRSGYNVDTDTTYRIVNYALSDVVTQGMRDQAAPPMNPEIDTAEDLTDILALNKEYLAASALFNTGSGYFSGYTETLNSGSTRYQWNDYTNSTPIEDIRYAINSKISVNSGAASDFAIVMGQDVWTETADHPDILERIKYSQLGVISTDLVKQIFEVDNLYVGKSLYNSANEGQTASLARVWGKYILVYHRGKPRIKTSACAVMLHGGNYVRKWTDNELRGATVIEVEEAFQPKILSARSGYLFSTAVA